MDHDERLRIFPFRVEGKEVNTNLPPLPLYLGLELWKSIEFLLPFPPFEPGRPLVNGLIHPGSRHTNVMTRYPEGLVRLRDRIGIFERTVEFVD